MSKRRTTKPLRSCGECSQPYVRRSVRRRECETCNLDGSRPKTAAPAEGFVGIAQLATRDLEAIKDRGQMSATIVALRRAIEDADEALSRFGALEVTAGRRARKAARREIWGAVAKIERGLATLGGIQKAA